VTIQATELFLFLHDAGRSFVGQALPDGVLEGL
jgi:hypothetical protein